MKTISSLPNKAPNRVMKLTHAGSAPYNIYLYADEDRAYLTDAGGTLLFTYGPINDKTINELNNILRNAFRYLSGLERDARKLKEKGFNFVNAPGPLPTGQAVAPSNGHNGKDHSENSGKKPVAKWL